MPGCKSKSRPAHRAKTAFAGKNYCFFSVVVSAPAELPDDGVLADEDGVLLLPDALDGALLLEPLAALPPLLGGVLPEALELDEPPEAGALGDALDEELELLSADEPGDTEPEAEPEAEPEGAVDGDVVEPLDEDEPGARAPVFGASRSQAVSNPAPSARDTAAARMESLMKASVVGVPSYAARFGPPFERNPPHHGRRQLSAAALAHRQGEARREGSASSRARHLAHSPA